MAAPARCARSCARAVGLAAPASAGQRGYASRCLAEAALGRPPRPESVAPPLGRAKALLRSLRVERDSKRLVRPDWDPERWARDALHEKAWPARLAHARECPRIDVSGRDLDPLRPAILTGAVDAWPKDSARLWSLEGLLRAHGDADWVIGATLADEARQAEAAAADAEQAEAAGAYGGDGEYSSMDVPVLMSLREYCEYSSRQRDDCPLYIFDDVFLEGAEGRALAGAFSRPRCLQEDFMAGLGELRPPHRWVLIGGERAGTALHQDPLETSAWNSLVSGRKRWVLFPPTAEALKLHARGGEGAPQKLQSLGEMSEVGDSAAHWMHHCYAHLTDSVGECYDFVQHPGETVYVPNGWWHNVVNLDFSVAVTENFVGASNLRAAYGAVYARDPEMAALWLRVMKADPSASPHLSLLEGLPGAGVQ